MASASDGERTMTGTDDGDDVTESCKQRKGKESHRARSGLRLPHTHPNEMKRSGMGHFASSSNRPDGAVFICKARCYDTSTLREESELKRKGRR